MSASSSLDRQLRRAVLLPLAGALIVGAVFLAVIQRLVSESSLLQRSQDVIVTAEGLRVLTIDLETGIRGYLLVHDERFLEPYNRASSQLPRLLQQLASLVADNPEQARRVAVLQRDVAEWLQYSRDIRHSRSVAEMARGKQLMDAFRIDHDAFIEAERAISVERTRRVRQTTAAAIAITAAIALIAGAILTSFIRRQLREVSATYQTAVAAAEESSAAKDRMLATVSHELRTPLTSILGWTQILRKREHDAELSTLAVDSIEQSARLQSRLIEDLIDVSRVVTGRMRIEIAEVDLRSILAAAAETLQPAAKAKNIDLAPSFTGEDLTVAGDATRLQQIFSNLLNNAVRFTPSGGPVSIDAARDDGMIRVAIRDNGVGIAPEFLPRVFEPFSQERDSAKTSSGLGLGLAIARRLVELHGGTIEAHSDGVGHGAEFVVQLPAAATSRS